MTSSPTSSHATASSGRVPLTPILFILGSCFSLQFGAALATQLFPTIGSWGTTALRLGLAALVLLVVVRPKMHRFTAQQWLAVAAFGVVVGAMNGAFYAAIDRIPLGTRSRSSSSARSPSRRCCPRGAPTCCGWCSRSRA